MGIPGWALPFGIAIKAPEVIGDIYGLYKGIRDDQSEQNDRNQWQSDAKALMKDPSYTPDLTKYSNPDAAVKVVDHLTKFAASTQARQAAPILDKFSTDYESLAGPDKRFFADPASREVLKQEGLQIPMDSSNPVVRKGILDFQERGQLENDIADNVRNPGDPNVLARIAANPLAQANHNVLATLQTAQDKSATRDQTAAKESLASQQRQNISDFQNAIGGLTGPSQSPNDLPRFAKRGGYAPISDVESDIRQAAADYNVGDSDEVNKAITGAREQYKNTFLPPQTVQVGRTTATGQTNLLGDFRKDVTSTAPVVKVNVNQPAPDAISRDAQAVLSGQLKPGALSKRNGYDAKVRAEVLKQNPNFNFVQADANAAYAQNSGNLNSRALIQGVEPLYDRLLVAGKELGNSSIPAVNRMKNWFKEATGQPEIVAFNNLRDDVIAESERILMGSGVLSDSKYLRAVKNVSEAGSMPQLNAAVRNLRLTVKSRLEALDKQPYPNQKSEQTAKGNIAPAGLKAKLPNGSIVTSDGKGGWK